VRLDAGVEATGLAAEVGSTVTPGTVICEVTG
jgi:hypothetical protein